MNFQPCICSRNLNFVALQNTSTIELIPCNNRWSLNFATLHNKKWKQLAKLSSMEPIKCQIKNKLTCEICK